jgi:hypothetical protein
MRREVAERIVDVTKRMDTLFNDLDALSDEIEDEFEKRHFRRAIGTVGLDLYEKVTRPIVKDFPDLHPDKENGGPS